MDVCPETCDLVQNGDEDLLEMTSELQWGCDGEIEFENPDIQDVYEFDWTSTLLDDFCSMAQFSACNSCADPEYLCSPCDDATTGPMDVGDHSDSGHVGCREAASRAHGSPRGSDVDDDSDTGSSGPPGLGTADDSDGAVETVGCLDDLSSSDSDGDLPGLQPGRRL